MRALVTGATGFVGSYLVEQLLADGAEVAIIRRHDSDLWRLGDSANQLLHIVGDLSDCGSLRGLIHDFSPDIVYHLAWQGVQNQYRNDPSQILVNLDHTISLMNACIEAGCRSWIGLGSQAEYGSQNRLLDETVNPTPTSMYGAAKLCAFHAGTQVAAQNNIRFVWMRLFSSYGPKDHPSWLLPYVIRTLLKGEAPSLTPGEQLWDYVYVTDAAEAIFLAGDEAVPSGIYNLGSGEVHTVRTIAETMRDIIDPSLPLGFGEVAYRTDQVMHLQADITKLTCATGWRPRTELKDGLTRMIDWYRAGQRP